MLVIKKMDRVFKIAADLMLLGCNDVDNFIGSSFGTVVFIDDDVIVIWQTADFLTRRCKTVCDILLGVGAASAQTCFQRLGIRREDINEKNCIKWN